MLALNARCNWCGLARAPSVLCVLRYEQKQRCLSSLMPVGSYPLRHMSYWLQDIVVDVKHEELATAVDLFFVLSAFICRVLNAAGSAVACPALRVCWFPFHYACALDSVALSERSKYSNSLFPPRGIFRRNADGTYTSCAREKFQPMIVSKLRHKSVGIRGSPMTHSHQMFSLLYHFPPPFGRLRP